MGTRANIVAHRADGTWASIYLNWDGYPKGAGRTLLDHFATQERVEALIALGDLSSLYGRIDAPEGHTYNTPCKGYTVAYHRDRGELWEDVKPDIGVDLPSVWPSEKSWIEFVYVWDGSWRVAYPESGPQALLDVASVFAGAAMPRPARS